MKKLLLTFILGMFLISSISALDNLGTFKQNDCVRIVQTCATCSYVNISSVSYPNSSIAIANKEMSDAGDGEWYYDFCNTSLIGRYDVRGKGDLSGTDTSFATWFDVNGTGYELTQQRTFIYLGLIGLLIFLFVVNIIVIPMLPSDNNRDEEGVLISVNQLKYLRPILYVTAYFLLMSIIYTSSNVALAYMGTTMFGSFLFMIFKIMFALALPMVFVWFIYLLHQAVTDKELKKGLERGIVS